MEYILEKRTRWARAVLLTVALLTTAAGAAYAGGVTPCENPFIFPGAAANIVPIEYLATSADRDSGGAWRERIQNTAQHLAWLIKLDSWHQPTYGSLGAIAHMYLGEICDPDETLARLISGYSGPEIGHGQVLLMLQGHIFIDGGDIFIQSRLRGFRRNEVPLSEGNMPGGFFAHEGLSVALGESTLHATLPPLDVTFAPRALTFTELDGIDKSFRNASKVYPDRAVTDDSEELHFEAGQQYAFRVQILDDGDWLKVEDDFGGISGYIQADPKASQSLHARLPELDFLNGLLGFLRVSQKQNDADYSRPPASAARHARTSLARFIASERAADDAEARGLAYALSGILAATDGAVWTEARKEFAAAAATAPHRSAYRNLLGLADASLCCTGNPSGNFADPAHSFTDSLSVDPDDEEALLNLNEFLSYLKQSTASSKPPPPGIDISRLTQRSEIVRKVLADVTPNRQEAP